MIKADDDTNCFYLFKCLVICTVNREEDMSRTKHHRDQKSIHCGYDYGGKYKHNKHYGGGYGADGRNAADKERREEGKDLCEAGIDELEMMTGDILCFPDLHDCEC